MIRPIFNGGCADVWADAGGGAGATQSEAKAATATKRDVFKQWSFPPG
jgi:hypothetical protein